VRARRLGVAKRSTGCVHGAREGERCSRCVVGQNSVDLKRFRGFRELEGRVVKVKAAKRRRERNNSCDETWKCWGGAEGWRKARIDSTILAKFTTLLDR